jgi:hypothetical protein
MGVEERVETGTKKQGGGSLENSGAPNRERHSRGEHGG